MTKEEFLNAIQNLPDEAIISIIDSNGFIVPYTLEVFDNPLSCGYFEANLHIELTRNDCN